MKDFLESQVSEDTRRSYRSGIKTFEKWYKKSIEELLKENDSGKILEKYWVWLKQNYRGNTPRTKINPIIQFCKFNNVEPKIKKSLHIHKQRVSVRDHQLAVSEARTMYGIGSLEEKIMVKTWLLGLRIKDVTFLEWKDFDFGEPSEELKEVRIITKKEEIPAHLFIDGEFQRLLAKYIPSIDKENPHLLQSNKGGKLSEKQLLRKLQDLQQRAQIETQKTFGWHIARDLRITLGLELGINMGALRLMVGKSLGPSMQTYVQTKVNLKKEAEKLSKALRMEEITNTTSQDVISAKELAQVALEGLGELLEPILEKKLLELQMSKAGGQSLGLIRKPDLSKLSAKEKVELFLKLSREEKERWR